MYTQYDDLSFRTSRLVTHRYSTSFSIGIRCLDAGIRDAVYSIYGFVRLADEIVDSFPDGDRERLFSELVEEYRKATRHGISSNPVVHAFCRTAGEYSIPDELTGAFLASMEKDLYRTEYDAEELQKYIYGSAEAVGLMCLKVFVGGDAELYRVLVPYASRLGAAFQKVNFLRDLGHDLNELHRSYFPVLREKPFDEEAKELIVREILQDYDAAEPGIKMLPKTARKGVYAAYLYYRALAERLKRMPAERIMDKRIRISAARKLMLLGKAYASPSPSGVRTSA